MGSLAQAMRAVLGQLAFPPVMSHNRPGEARWRVVERVLTCDSHEAACLLTHTKLSGKI
jgi:hypothetical protein